MCAPSFLVCAHLTTCVRAHAHSLEGTLPTTPPNPKYGITTPVPTRIDAYEQGRGIRLVDAMHVSSSDTLLMDCHLPGFPT